MCANQLLNSILLAPSAPPMNLLEVLLQSHSMMASKCMSNLARSWPWSASLNSVDHGLQTDSIAASNLAQLWPPKCISKLAQSWPPSASLSSLDCSPQVYLQTCSITAFKCISEFAQSQPASACPNLLNHVLQVHLRTCLINASKCISDFTQSSSSGSPRIALKHRLYCSKKHFRLGRIGAS